LGIAKDMSLNSVLESDFDKIYELYGSELAAFQGQRILIVGVNGMIASYLAQFLNYLKSVHQIEVSILGLARNIPATRIPGVDYLSGDVCNFNFKSVACDYVVHAASLASPIYYGSHPIETSLPNIEGTINLLRGVENQKLKCFLFLSSSEVYGAFPEDKNAIFENEYGVVDPMNQRSCYAESKRMGENLCVSWFQQKKVPCRVIRPFHTYGPGLRKDDGRVFADFIYSVVDRKNIVLNSKGLAQRAFCYLSDAIAGLLLVMLKGENGQAYNVGNPKEEWAIFEAAKIASEAFPERSIGVMINENQVVGTGYVKSAVLRNCPAIAKIQKLGWTPKVSLREGFRKTIEYIESERGFQ
jgi:nucleoside-diphosphate-sugar epimerase